MYKTFEDIKAWQLSREFRKEIYKITKKFPNNERFVLTPQMRRATISITSNIAEGFGRRSFKSSIQFYSFAYGSALELETQLIISKELTMAGEALFKPSESLLLEVSKMLNVMIGKMKKLTKEDTSKLVTNLTSI